MRRISPKIFRTSKTTSASSFAYRRSAPSACCRTYCAKRLAVCWLALALLLAGCRTDYGQLPAYSANGQLQVVIHTPAGSTHLQRYDAQDNTFQPVMEAGLARQFAFLPLPGNMGFIPSTSTGPGAEAQPLQVLVLAESLPAGTLQEVIPLSTLVLDVNGELQACVIAVPARPSQQAIQATDWASFQQRYPAARDILQLWFLHAQPDKTVRLSAWRDDVYTTGYIRDRLR
ncbi:MAG: inorganic diphosphatase [Adhaeribacter sp.]